MRTLVRPTRRGFGVRARGDGTRRVGRQLDIRATQITESERTGSRDRAGQAETSEVALDTGGRCRVGTLHEQQASEEDPPVGEGVRRTSRERAETHQHREGAHNHCRHRGLSPFRRSFYPIGSARTWRRDRGSGSPSGTPGFAFRSAHRTPAPVRRPTRRSTCGCRERRRSGGRAFRPPGGTVTLAADSPQAEPPSDGRRTPPNVE